MSGQLQRYFTNIVLFAPPIIYFKNNFYSFYRVDGSSMEPALLHGDVVLVRKSDIYPDRMWRKFTSLATSYEEEEIHQNAMRVLATEASSNRPIGEWMTAHTYLKPPTIHELGAVIVFQAPDAAKYPTSEYRAKRVIGLGGQLCRPSGNHHRLERVPPFGLWVEGDNQDCNNNERSVDSNSYGAVCKNSIIGVAEFIVWPPSSRWGKIPCITPPEPRSWWM